MDEMEGWFVRVVAMVTEVTRQKRVKNEEKVADVGGVERGEWFGEWGVSDDSGTVAMVVSLVVI